MKPAASWRIEKLLKASLPGVSGMIFVLLAAVPYGVPHLAVVMPWLGLMPVYYWSIHEPRYLPAWLAFAIGLWQDALTGGPLGLFALIFLVVRQLVSGQRHIFFNKPFLVGWWGFGLVVILASFAGWLIASLYFAGILPPLDFIAQAALSIMVYPAAAWVLGAIWMVISD